MEDKIRVHLGQRSLFELIDTLVQSEESVACLVHDDVTLPSSFLGRIEEFVSSAAHDWPNWGVAGNAGVSHLGIGLGSSPVVRYLSDPHGGPNNIGIVTPVETIDGNVILLNCAALRDAGVRLPAFDGFHLYDIALSIETLSAGLAVLCTPSLSCHHNSAGDQSGFDAGAGSDGFRRYLASRISNTHVVSMNGLIDLTEYSTAYRDCERIDIALTSLRTAQRGRPKRSLSIVTRSQFTRPALLQRCAASVASFAADACYADVDHVVLTSAPSAAGLAWPEIEVMAMPTNAFDDDRSNAFDDDRFLLVEYACQQLTSEYVWFVDDDDWLFPNDAELISLAISLCPEGAPVFVDSQHFHESGSEGAAVGALPALRAVSGRRFPADGFLRSLSGHNHTPICSAILPRKTVLSIPADLVSRITFFEDYTLVLQSLLQPHVTPITVQALAAGISVREEGQSVVTSDRTVWNQSMAELTTHLVDDAATSLLSLPEVFVRTSRHDIIGREAELARMAELNESLRLERDEALRELDRVSDSLSWILARPFRAAHKVLTGQVGVREILRRN